MIALPFDEPGFVTQALYDEPFSVTLPTSHPWCQRNTISSAELEKESLLLLGQGHCFRDQILQACPALNRSNAAPGSIQKTLEGSSLETIRHMVASGAGITVLPCSAIGTGHERKRPAGFPPVQQPRPQPPGSPGLAQALPPPRCHCRRATSRDECRPDMHLHTGSSAAGKLIFIRD